MGGVLAFERDSSGKGKMFLIKCLPLLYTELLGVAIAKLSLFMTILSKPIVSLIKLLKLCTSWEKYEHVMQI